MLFGGIRCKGSVGGRVWAGVEAAEKQRKRRRRQVWRAQEGTRMGDVPMKWVDLTWKTKGEGTFLVWGGERRRLRGSDAERRRAGEQSGLETHVVQPVNDVHDSFGVRSTEGPWGKQLT